MDLKLNLFLFSFLLLFELALLPNPKPMLCYNPKKQPKQQKERKEEQIQFQVHSPATEAHRYHIQKSPTPNKALIHRYRKLDGEKHQILLHLPEKFNFCFLILGTTPTTTRTAPKIEAHNFKPRIFPA